MELDRSKLNRLIDRLGQLRVSQSGLTQDHEDLLLEAHELAISIGEVPVAPLFESVSRAAGGSSAEFIARGGRLEVNSALLEALSPHVLSWFESVLQAGSRMVVMQANRTDDTTRFTLMSDTPAPVVGLSSAVRAIGGTIEIRSKDGEGMGIVISVPTPSPVMSAFFVRVGDRAYALPSCKLAEVMEASRLKIHTSTGVGRMIRHRGEILPLLSVEERLLGATPRQLPAGETALAGVVVQSRGRKFCFPVDEILGRGTILLKPVGPEISGIPGILGATLLPEGESALVIDLGALVPRAQDQGRADVAA